MRSEEEPTQIHLLFIAMSKMLINQDLTLGRTQRLAQHPLPLHPKLFHRLLRIGCGSFCIRTINRTHRTVEGRSRYSGPIPIEPPRAKGRIFGLSEPDGADGRVALGIAESEVEGEVGVRRLKAGAVEGRGRSVGWFFFLLFVRTGVIIVAKPNWAAP